MMLLQTVRHRSQLRLSFGVFVLVLSLATSAGAQSAGTGSIGGTARDPNGLVVPGVEVTIRNLDTGAERKLTTNEAGLYAAPFLQPGRYEVRGQKAGFASVVRTDLRLEVGQALTVDIDLPLKAEQQTVTVTVEAGLVETEKVEVSQTIDQGQVENLPLNGRRWDTLALLTPGAIPDGGFGLISFRGVSGLYNNNMVDGADNNQAFFSEARGRDRLPYGYSLDAIKEFNVSTAAYSAELGRAAGGTVNAVTKSGTNGWHGDAFYFIRDSALLARDPIAKAGGQPKPDERRQQFGGSFGGPLVHDRLFFFLNYDQQRNNFPAIINTSAPNFFTESDSTSAAGMCEAQTPPGVANCQAVLNEMKPIFNATDPRNGSNYIGLAKLDYQLNTNNHISGAFNILRWDSLNGIQTPAVIQVPSQAQGNDDVATEFLTVNWNSVVTPSVVNEVRFQYGRDFEFEPANHSGPSLDLRSNGGAALGMPTFLPRPSYPNEKRFQWVDNLSWIHGRHQFKVGMDINYVRDRLENLISGGGAYSYSGSAGLRNLVLDLLGIPPGTPPSLGALPTRYRSFQQTGDPVTGSGKGFFTTTDYNAYFQDNIKAHPNLTVNLGLRYELEVMPNVIQANPNVPETASLNTATKDFGPRVGFSWSPGKDQKQVIRGGYGIYYGRTQNSTIFTFLFQNGVFQQQFSFSPAASGVPPSGLNPACVPTVPNVWLPQPSSAPAFSTYFAGATSTLNPQPTALFPSVAAFAAACPSLARGASVTTLDSNFVNPRIHEFDLAYERELPWKLSASASYVGSRGNHLPIFVDANLPGPDTSATYLVFDGSGNALAPTSFQVPFFSSSIIRPNTNVGVILMGKSVVNSWYHGLVLRLRRRESHGFSFDTNFTWSQARDNGACGNADCTFAGTTSALNPFDLRSEYGLSSLDIRRRFVMSLHWATPFGNWTDNRGFKAVIGGWKVGSVWTVQDGRPVTANLSASPNCSTGNRDGGLTCGAIAASSTGSFAPNGRAPFIGRNAQFTSPAIAVFDLRIAREFKTTERTSFELIWEAFNIFNHTEKLGVRDSAFDFVGPGGTIWGTQTCPTTVGVGGCLVLRQPPRVSAGDAFLSVNNTSNVFIKARQMQLAAKFRF